MIGKAVSHYKILSKLGEGGMGVVYKAEDTRLDRHVAIKFLPPQLSSDRNAKNRFIREAKAASALNHANIAVVHEIDETPEGHTFMVMACYEGQTLKDRLESGPLEVDEAITIVSQVASGLAKAHEKGILHRDIKPGNILMGDDGQAKLADFGLATLAGQTKITKTGTTVGTVAYMSPEQASGGEVDHRSDIFSLGVLLYELLTGDLPFRGDHEAAVLYGVMNTDPEPPTTIRSDLPPALDRIVEAALCKDAGARYQSVADLLADLKTDQPDGLILGSSRKQTKSLARTVLPLAIAAIVVAGAYSGYMLLREGREVDTSDPMSEAEAVARSTIGVIGFDNLSDPADGDRIGRMLTGLIVTDLSESGGLSVASTSKVLDAYKQAGGVVGGVFDASLATETARRAGAGIMLVGQVIQNEEGVLLTAELVDVQSGNLLGSLKGDATSSAELFSLAGSMAADIRVRLGVDEAALSDQLFDLAQSLTDSPEAYRQFAAGELALHEGLQENIDYFRQAVRTDSTFALAWYRLAVSLANWNEVEASLEAFASGQRYLERLPTRWQTMYKTEHAYHRGEVDEAYTALSELVETAKIPDAYYRLGEIATHFSRYYDLQKAKTCFEMALEIDPTFKVVSDHLLLFYLILDERESAEQLLDRFRMNDSLAVNVRRGDITLLLYQRKYDEAIAGLKGVPYGGAMLGRALAQRGDFEAAFKVADDEVKESPDWYIGAIRLHNRATYHWANGRFSDAMADFQEAAELLASKGQDATWAKMYVVDNHLSVANLLWLTGDTAGAINAAREAILTDRFEPRSYFWAGFFLLDSGNRHEARDMLNDLESVRAESFSPATECYLHLLRAVIHRTEGSLDDAVSELEKASAEEFLIYGRETRSLLWADVLATRGDRSGAIEAYREILRITWGCCSPPYQDGRWSIRKIQVLYELGRLLEEDGDPEGASEYYQTYLDRWGVADVAISNVEEARARLKSIEVR